MPGQQFDSRASLVVVVLVLVLVAAAFCLCLGSNRPAWLEWLLGWPHQQQVAARPRPRRALENQLKASPEPPDRWPGLPDGPRRELLQPALWRASEAAPAKWLPAGPGPEAEPATCCQPSVASEAARRDETRRGEAKQGPSGGGNSWLDWETWPGASRSRARAGSSRRPDPVRAGEAQGAERQLSNESAHLRPGPISCSGRTTC